MPKLYEMRPLPTEVGGVPIVWFDPSKVDKSKRRYNERQLLARREKGTLLLPNNAENVFLPLGTDKLLFIHDFYYGYPGSYSFCGKDESPFHVFVTDNAVNTYKKRGSEGFFESLIPPFIKMLRDRPDIPDSYVRQGDWFTNRLPFSWEKIEQFMRLSRGKEFGTEEVKKRSLGGTRHHFAGRIAEKV